MSFLKADVNILVTDPHRAGHELNYHPGETNLYLADVVIINKVDSAARQDIDTLFQNIHSHRPGIPIIKAASKVSVNGAERIQGKRVLVVEDGPTLTHGGMAFGAGVIAARRFGAKEIIDPRPFAQGSIAETFRSYPHITDILPAMGYSAGQQMELEATINASDAELVLIGTPIDLGRLLNLNKPALRVHYQLQELDKPGLDTVLNNLIQPVSIV